MNEIIERVAKAIAAQSGSEGWKAYLGEARAAIAAMREPTKEMIEAYSHDMYEPDPREQWQQMLDAALK